MPWSDMMSVREWLMFFKGTKGVRVTNDFGWALDKLKQGCKVSRQGWNGKDMWLKLCDGDNWETKMTLPYIFLKTSSGDFAPWTPSQCDILGQDWE